MITKLKNILELVKSKIKKYYNKVVQYLLNSKYRKRNLTIIGALILISIFLLNSFFSYAYYNDFTSFVLIHAKVGDVKAKTADYSLQIFLENQNKKGSYKLGKSIPYIGYTYSGYTCSNNGTLVYDDVLKTTKTTIANKDACVIYFDLVQDSDFTVLVKTESNYNSGVYTDSDVIPYYGYSFNKLECENGSTGTYNTKDHYLELIGTKKDVCTVYFNKMNVNNTVNLFLENSYQSANYIKRNSFVQNVNYTLNKVKSGCKNSNGENVDTTIEYINGEINITGDNLVCDIYMDRTND